MTCKEVEILLAAMVEGVLSAEERRGIEAHLRSCDSCRQALEDLKKTDERVKSLGEVDPPPWLKTRVMARVREEAGQKEGILRKLFHPLYVKVPIQALATVLIAVVAWNVYKTGEPEYRQIVPPPAAQEAQRTGASGESLKTEESAAQPEKEADLKTGVAEKRALAPSAARREDKKELPSAAGERAKADGTGVMAPGRAAEPDAAPLKDAAVAKGVNAVRRPETNVAARAPDAEQKQKASKVAIGSAAREAGKQEAASAGRPALSSAAPAQPVPDMILHVRNAGQAAGVIENEVKRLGGEISDKRTLGDRISLSARIGTDQIEAMRVKIRSLGPVRETLPDDRRPGAEGLVVIRIEIRQE